VCKEKRWLGDNSRGGKKKEGVKTKETKETKEEKKEGRKEGGMDD